MHQCPKLSSFFPHFICLSTFLKKKIHSTAQDKFDFMPTYTAAYTDRNFLICLAGFIPSIKNQFARFNLIVELNELINQRCKKKTLFLKINN